MKELYKDYDKYFDNNLIHLHCHNTYSQLDGYGLPIQHTDVAKELGMSHIAITNHNHLAGSLDFDDACKSNDIKPIFGCEMYYTEDTSILSMEKVDRDRYAAKLAFENGEDISEKPTLKEMKEKKGIIDKYAYDTKQYHILFLAKNQNGWKNLVKLQSEASIVCTFNGRYLADFDLIEKYKEDLICTTACLGSYPASKIMQGDAKSAESYVDKMKQIFGDDFYLEIQPLEDPDQVMVNMKYMEWSLEKGIKLVATNDVHYPRKEDNDVHDMLLCIGLGRLRKDPNRMRYKHSFWIKSYDEMMEGFKEQTKLIGERAEKYLEHCKYALATTNEIKEKIEKIKLGSDVPLFPKVDTIEGLDADETLEYETYRSLYEYAKKNDFDKDTLRIYEDRAYTELDVIKKKGYSPYFLSVKDYIENSNKRGCPSGPGRGSAAGSLVSFLNGIIKVTDPIKYNLLFFRFLTEDRTSPPDIDTDFCYENRHKVIEYLEDKYGEDHVCHIYTTTKLGLKNGIKDVGKALGYEFTEMNRLTKEFDVIFDDDAPKTFKKLKSILSDISEKMSNNEEVSPKDKSIYTKTGELMNKYKDVFHYASRIEGNIRNTGVHASGILVTPFPVTDLFPIRLDKDGVRVALYTGEELERLNAVKFDILGLKTVTSIDKTMKSIGYKKGINYLYENGHIINDEETLSMIRDIDVNGVFQISSNLFKSIIREMKPDRFEDMVALTALCRPGPLKANMPSAYCDRKHGVEEPVEPIANTYDILDETFGTIVYQEDLMLIAQRIAGFDDNQSDTYLRKATAKQNESLMQLCRQWLIWGKVNEDAPEGYDPSNKNQAMYDPEGKYGAPIKGAVNNGYEEEELIAFWEKLKGYSSYLFNKSHSVSYSVITMFEAYLKKYYRPHFMSSSLSLEGEEETREILINELSKNNIPLRTPDINRSDVGYKYDEETESIVMGLSSVKSVGDKSIPEILKNRPYESLEDLMERVPKKFFNKSVGRNLIKAGAFDQFEPNRYKLINEFYDIRKDKDDRYNEEDWGRDACIEFEEDVLGTSITFKKWIDEIEVNSPIVVEKAYVKSIREHVDRNGNLMAFANLNIEDSEDINTVIFARTYISNMDKIKEGNTIKIKCKKQDDNSLILMSLPN